MQVALRLSAMTAALLTFAGRHDPRGRRRKAIAATAQRSAALSPAEAAPPTGAGRLGPQRPHDQAGSGAAEAAPFPRVPLGPLVERAIAAAARLTGQGLRHWQPDPALRRLELRADEAALETVLGVLLARAVLHSRDGDIIALRWIITNERVAIVVEDEGDGLLDPDAAPVEAGDACPLGAELARCGTRRKACEFGESCDLDIGLRQARRLAAAQGGDLWIEAAPGIGARAWLTLPRAQMFETA